jgi:hypothetical protein
MQSNDILVSSSNKQVLQNDIEVENAKRKVEKIIFEQESARGELFVTISILKQGVKLDVCIKESSWERSQQVVFRSALIHEVRRKKRSAYMYVTFVRSLKRFACRKVMRLEARALSNVITPNSGNRTNSDVKTPSPEKMPSGSDDIFE